LGAVLGAVLGERSDGHPKSLRGDVPLGEVRFESQPAGGTLAHSRSGEGDESLSDESLGDESLGDESLGDESLGDESLGDESLGGGGGGGDGSCEVA